MFWIIIIVSSFILLVVIVGSNNAAKEREEKEKQQKIKTSKLKALDKFSREYVFSVAGVRYNMDTIYGFCNELDVVNLKEEPDNKFDANAILVLHGFSKIGYVPEFETDEVIELLRFDHIAYIKKLDKDPSWINVEIGIKY